MAATSADTQSSQSAQDAPRRGRPRKRTTLDSHVDRPGVVQPGDLPFTDTTDPTERATSVEPDKAAAAAAGYGTVNAVVPLPAPERPDEGKKDERTETYKVNGPDGKLVTVRHNIDTGETSTE